RSARPERTPRRSMHRPASRTRRPSPVRDPPRPRKRHRPHGWSTTPNTLRKRSPRGRRSPIPTDDIPCRCPSRCPPDRRAPKSTPWDGALHPSGEGAVRATSPPVMCARSSRLEGAHMTTHEHRRNLGDEISVNPLFAREGEETIPRWRIPDGEMLPDSAYQVIHGEPLLDANAGQNVATFVTTWMEPQADKVYAEAFDKNMIDKDEYPQTAAIEERCVHILADLWNSPEPHTTIGASAIGSSEACMLAGLALLRRW